MDLADRLRNAMQRRGLRQSRLAALAGIPDETLSHILTGKTRDPRVSTLMKLAEVLEVTVGWLLGEKGYEISGDDRAAFRRAIEVLARVVRETQPPSAGSAASNVTPVLLARKPPRHAPRRSRIEGASATTWRELFGDVMEDDVDIPDRYVSLGANLVFRAEGDSMEGAFIAHGDLLFVREERDSRAARGKIVVAVVDRTPYVKRLDYGGNRIRLIGDKLSENDPHPTMEFDEQTTEWFLVGVVVGSSHDHR